MKKMYSSYRCRRCNCESILISEYVSSALEKGNYISCAYCGSKKLIKIKEDDSLKECMRHSAYKKVHGAFRQVRNE